MSIKRYDEHPDGGGMREDVLGAYVKSDDIRHLLFSRNVDDDAESLARQIWGYFKGDSTGGTTAMQWFDANKSLGGPAHIINLCRAALVDSFPDPFQSPTQPRRQRRQ